MLISPRKTRDFHGDFVADFRHVPLSEVMMDFSP